jgi:hypothetical protein
MKSLVDVLVGFGQEIDTEGLQGTLRSESERIDKEVLVTEQHIASTRESLEREWSEAREFAYELSSVFMHR